MTPISRLPVLHSARTKCVTFTLFWQSFFLQRSRVSEDVTSVDFYTFKDPEVFNVFESFVSSLRSGETVHVEKSNFPALLRLFQELENDELLSSLLGMIDIESLSLEEAILLLRIGIDLGTAFSDRFENLRDFVASRFYELEKEILDLQTLELLLSSPSLKIEDEDSLYDFVRSRSEKDLRFTSLFEFVYFEYLTVDRIEDFSSFVRENFLENISSGIWRQICRRLILEAKTNETNPNSDTTKKATESGTQFVYNESNKLDGIIAHLTRQCGGNVHDKGAICIGASAFYNDHDEYYGDVRNVVELGTESDYWSEDFFDPWICYDFKDLSVIPTSYSIMSASDHQPKSWVLEVSNNGYSWTEIDRRDNNNELKDAYVTVNFKISCTPSESFRFLRLRQTGENHKRGHMLRLCSLEIFGILCEK